jgi:hypothetical protein
MVRVLLGKIIFEIQAGGLAHFVKLDAVQERELRKRDKFEGGRRARVEAVHGGSFVYTGFAVEEC